jgi:hypothetical protein
MHQSHVAFNLDRSMMWAARPLPPISACTATGGAPAGHHEEAGRDLGTGFSAGSVLTHSWAPIVSRISMCALSTISSIEDVFVNIAAARPKTSVRVGKCGR